MAEARGSGGHEEAPFTGQVGRGELVRLFGTRPAWVEETDWTRSERCWVSVSVHDDYYLRTRAAWRRMLAGHAYVKGQEFGTGPWAIEKRYRAWQRAEERWYRRFGLEPPARAGLTPAHKRWRTRRQRHGANGLTADATERMRERTRTLAQRRRRRVGHASRPPETED